MANLSKSMKRAFFIMGIAFFFLIVATVYTVYLATKEYEPVVDPNYYEKGLNYDKEIGRKLEMKNEGYRFETNLLTEKYPLKTGSNTVSVLLFKNSEKVQDAKTFMQWERSATNKFTKRVPLHFSKENSQYTGTVDIPYYGQWIITLIAEINGKVFEKRFLTTVKE
ncbi:MAG: FixH family protein [Leptospiraceae bacterium]|nr:FixH family protein [Leptospiraceae bacterium]MCP5495514.1 FixH family protein [Leptospiraceae bacterium]